jgi:hypothetical protein
MIHPEITSLYKYFPKHERVLSILRSRHIYYPKPDQFNDPFDCDIDIASAVSWKQFAEVIRIEGKKRGRSDEEIARKIESVVKDPSAIEEYRRKVAKGVDQVRGILRKQGILSLSASPSSIPMWGYYANGHRGMCMEFRRSSENVLGTTATRPIEYIDVYLDATVEN